MKKITIKLLEMLVLGMFLAGCSEKNSRLKTGNPEHSKKGFVLANDITRDESPPKGTGLGLVEDVIVGKKNRGSEADTLQPKSLIRYHGDEVPYSDFKIQFLSPATGKIEKEFDIIANNPYNKLKYPVLRKDEINSCNVYDLSGMELDDETISYLTSYRKTPMDFKPEITLVSSTISIYKEGKNFTAIAYNLLAEISGLEPVGYRGTAIIFDKMGNIVRRFEHLDVDIINQIVTEDGKYFCFIYGRALTEDGNPLTNEGFRIYSIQNGELLVEEEVASANENYSRPVLISESNKIRISSRLYSANGGRPKFKCRVFDLDRRIYYYKIYPAEKWDLLFNVLDNGVAFKTRVTGQIDKELFETHFTKRHF